MEDQAPERVVDLRSDTVTKPTQEMRLAMFEAEVDDDILMVDPTMGKLQKKMADHFGKEAGLFVPSGTMGNLICILAHCESRGSEAIIGSESHINVYEQGGMSTLGGVFPCIIQEEPDGTINLNKVKAAIKPVDNEHYAQTRLICIENTHNRCGGRCLSVEYSDEIGALAKSYGIKLHIDGARILNAAVALGVSPKKLVRAADSVSICLSKGLAAPAGSMIVGTHEFICKAKWLRKALGGAMRQVGVLAAPALVAFNKMAERLHEDHKKARLLAEKLSCVEGLSVDVNNVQTNIVNVEVLQHSGFSDAKSLCHALKMRGVLAYAMTPKRIRLVTHYHISEEDVLYTIRCFRVLL